VHQAEKPEGMLWDSDEYRTHIWVKTWAQILHDSRTRLNVFQKELNHSADRDASLSYLKETYARVLSGMEIEDEDSELAADSLDGQLNS